MLGAPLASAGQHFAFFERDYRTVQALTIAGVLAVIYYYRIDVGKNLRGIIAGFGLYVGSTILSHALRAFAGSSFGQEWSIIQPYTYFVSLLIWAMTLWSYAPVPVPDVSPEPTRSYEAFARGTKEELGAIRAQVGRAERQ
jgi:hypothetical protein